MKHHVGLAILALIFVACAPIAEPTPGFERAPSLAPSATVLPIIPQDDPNAFVGRSDPTAAALAAEGHPSQDPPSAPQATEQSIPITVIADDGRVLSSRYFGAAARTDAAILLLHDADGETAALMTLGAGLQGAGFNVMVLSLRGYPPSGGQIDWAAAVQDTLGGIRGVLTLPDVTRVAVLGTGRSATAAMLACGQNPQCTAIILVNPIPDAANNPIEEAASQLGARPLLMLVSQNRADSQQSAQIIQANRGGTASLQIFPTLALDQLIMTTPLIDWLLQEFSTSAAE